MFVCCVWKGECNLSLLLSLYHGIMASFGDKVVSLEDNEVIKPLLDPQYLDISDFEDDGIEKQMR